MRIPKLCRNSDGRAFAYVPRSRGKRRQYFGRYGSPESQLAYREWLQRLLAGYEPQQPHELSVADLADRFMEYTCDKYGRQSTEFSVTRAALRTLVSLSGSLPAAELGPRLLGAFKCHLEAQRRPGKGLYSRTYVNKQLARVKRLVRWAVSEELLPGDRYQAVRTVEGIRKGADAQRVGPVEWIVVRATLPWLHEPVRSMVVVQYLCGMRPKEVCQLRPRELRREGRIWIYTPEVHKGSHRGHVLVKAVPPSAQRILSRCADCPDDVPIFRPNQAPRFNKRQQVKAAYTTAVYDKAVRRACERAQKHQVPIPCWTPNQLRHGVATAIRAILGHDAATAYLGHSHPDTTAIYAARMESGVTAVAEAMEERHFSKIL